MFLTQKPYIEPLGKVITVDDLVAFTTTSTSATIDGLSPSTAYTIRVYSHSDSWDVAYDEINTTTTA